MDPELILFHEPGARWRTLLIPPILCAIALVIELFTGPVVHWVGLAAVALVLTGFLYVQVTAARMHVRVLLTPITLSQGVEDLPVEDIVTVYPPPDYDANPDGERWERARSLGELSSIPRRRSGIGLKIRGGGVVQAWAKDDDGLREHLSALVADRTSPPEVPPGGAFES